ncbi:MAG TPA: PEP/pyruvate-binding domain-containing protein [Bacteroidota bacterium]|nr:PEP/pyruvate-binding domain-containing protein [Bacteroidota bacterium]
MTTTKIPSVFSRKFFDAAERFSIIGSGSVGGKALGLEMFQTVLEQHADLRAKFPEVEISIPRLAVIGTDHFTAFMDRNRLRDVADSSEPDEKIIREFLKADLPAELVGDLRALIEGVRTPLAIRSSSLLEDAMHQPFAGIYQTKMIPNNQPEIDTRFAKLVEAVKFVYASTFSQSAKTYRRALADVSEERMAVVIQEVVGKTRGGRFYPELSGVARSWNFYPTGSARPEEGVVQLALGLGKTIVDGGLCWTYSPSRPKASPPFASVHELAEQTQTEFWSVNMGTPPAYDPITETEYLTRGSLADAEQDGILGMLASTLNPESDRLSVGIADRGMRILTFAPLLVSNHVPVNDIVRMLLAACEKDLSAAVEIEFAMTLNPLRLGCVQVRKMLVSTDKVEIGEGELSGEHVLAASDKACGNGHKNDIVDIIYVVPDTFDKSKTRTIAADLEKLNLPLVEEGRHSLMIGFGRWGSSDPWLGIPVNWGQISSARAIVEATLPSMNVDLSQGSHFFHNLMSFGVSYFSVHHEGGFSIDWAWLKAQKAVQETSFVRHVRLKKPLAIKVDGRKGMGVIRK